MSIKVKKLPNSERPYEKLEMYGEKMLSNSELLAIIIKTGTKSETSVELAQKILSLKGETIENLRYLQDISLQEYMKIKGIGRVKAIQIKAVCELAKRMSRPINTLNTKINNPKDVVKLLMEEIKYEKREIVKLLMLNAKNELQKIIDITIGTSSSAVIKPKDILIEPIKMGIPKIILVHNHPSGDSTPSIEDIEQTKKLLLASEILGVQLLDHIIIGENEYKSIIIGNIKTKNTVVY